MKCPLCDGSGHLLAAFQPVVLACILCSGSGSVTEQQMAWRETGLQLRRKRLDSNMTLRDFARASKIDLDPLQRMEIGAQDPTPLKEAHARIFNP